LISSPVFARLLPFLYYLFIA